MDDLQMRNRVVRVSEKKVLIADLNGTKEAADSYSDLNCGGFGRVRRFENYSLHAGSTHDDDLRRTKRMLLSNYPHKSVTTTQVFQLAGCAWRCWYCYVDESRLAGHERFGKWLSCDDLLDMYMSEPDRPDIIDLSGGQPDLVPEWPVWMIEACEARGLTQKVYIRSENNLSNDFLNRFLKPPEIQTLARFPTYTKIGCFKGFDEVSFAHNTGASHEGFITQFAITDQIIRSGIDFYSYATFTTPDRKEMKDKMRRFVDLLQNVHELLPLRVVPLRVAPFSAWKARRISFALQAAAQAEAHCLWASEIEERFSQSRRASSLEMLRLN